MWEMPSSLSQFDRADRYQRLGRPKKVFLGDYLWKAVELVQPVTIPLDLHGSKVYLGDFGLTIKDGTSVDMKLQTPYRLCAPERLHDTDPSFASDMWSYMCLFGLLYLGNNIFYGNGGESTAFSWVEQLGAMPEKWKGRFWCPGEVKDAWYDHATTTSDPKRDLASRIARLRPDASQAKRDLVLSVIHKVFCYLPEHRITAEQLLQDPSFKAIMEIYQC